MSNILAMMVKRKISQHGLNGIECDAIIEAAYNSTSKEDEGLVIESLRDLIKKKEEIRNV